MTTTISAERPALVGNRLVLAGSVLYLLEWVAIVAASVNAPVGADASAHDLVSAYAGHGKPSDGRPDGSASSSWDAS